MSKTHSKPAKALSVFLCALMVLSTVCFFNPFTALKANAFVDVNSTQSANDGYDLTFNVPESIYLKPGSDNLEYFLTNTVKSKGATAVSTAASSANVSVSSPYATSMTLSYEVLTSGKDANGKDVAISGALLKADGSEITGAKGTNSVSVSLDRNTKFSGFSTDKEGSEAYIKWKLVYVADGVTHTVYAYTTLYMPYLGQSGMTAHSRHEGTYANPENWTYSFITGGHSVTGGNVSSKFTSNEAVKKDATNASNAVFVAPLVEFTGGNAGKERADTDYPFNNGGTVPWGSYFYTDAFNAQANGGVALKSNSTSADDYYPCNDSDLGTMKITVDTSRFPNYNQIPNLSVGWAQFRHDWDGGDNRLYWISGLNGTKTSGMSESGLTGATITTNADTSRFEGYSSLAKGLYSLNGAVTAGDHLMVFCYRNSYKPYVGNQSKVRTFAGVNLNVTAVDKAELRNAVFNAFNHGYSASMASSALETAIADASKVLSDVFATQSEVTAATNKLNTAVNNAKSSIASYFAKYEKSIVSDTYAFVPETIYLTPNATSATGFQYFVNNTVTFSGNTYSLTADSVNNATSGKFYFKCADAVSLRVVANGNTATVNGTLKSGSETKSGALSSTDISDSTSGGLTVNLTDGYAEGTVTSGSLKSGLAQNGTKDIQWRFIYTLKDGNTREAVTAYTVAYAPYCEPVGTAVNSYDSNMTESSAQHVSWWQGVHAVGARPSDIDTSMQKLDTDTDYSANLSKFSPILGRFSAPTSDSDVTGWLSTGSSTKTIRYAYARHDCDGQWMTVRATGYTALITVDSSRYANLSQVPNVKAGTMVTSMKNSGSDQEYKVWKYTGTPSHNSSYSDSNFHGVYDSDDGLIEKGTERLGVVFNNPVDYSFTSSTVDSFIYKAATKHKSTKYSGFGVGTKYAYACGVTFSPISITKVDKSGLRSKIADVIKLAQQFDWSFGNSSVTSATSTLSGNLQTAYHVLGNPLATSTEITNAINNLNTNAEAIKNAIVTRSNTTSYSGTATANHYALVKTVSSAGVVSANPLKVAAVITDKGATSTAAADTENYFGSDTVVIGKNNYDGFTYQGYMTNKSYAAIGANAPTSYYKTNTEETYLRIDETIKNEGRDILHFYYTAPDEHLTVDLNGGESTVENFNCDITASAGSTFTPAVPTKAGYTFAGWKLDGAGKLANGTYTFGLGDGKLTAQWTPVPTESTELIVDPNGGTMNGNELLFIEHGAQSATGDNGNGTLTYNITKSDDGQSLNISGHYKGFTYGEANATGERTQIIPVWVYLETGKSYTISWNSSNDITEFFLFKNGDLKTRTSFNPGKSGAYSFTFTVGDARWYFDSSLSADEKDATGWYELRLDQNMPVAAEGEPANEGDYTITGLSITSNGDAKLGYKQAAETEVFISEPVRDGYKFAGFSGLVNGTLTKVDADATNVNGGYTYTFKGKADTLVAQWTDAVYEIGFDNLFLATDWAENSYTSASNDTVGYDKDNDIITYKNNKVEGDTADTESRRAESSYHITGLVPGKEYILSYDFASDMAGNSKDNDCNAYVFAHFYDANGSQIDIKNSDINYGAQGDYVGKYIIKFTDSNGVAQSQITPSEWAGGDKRIFSGLQTSDVVTKDGYGHSDIIFTAPAGTVSMDISFGAQHAGQTVSFKNVQVNEYDSVNPITDYSKVQKSYGKDTAVFGELATAKRLGYDFKGWFTEKDGKGTAVTASTSTSPYHTKFTVWSNWEEINYTVTYDAAGGTLASGTVNPTKYTINTEKITVAAAPTKQGYIFKGWKITKDTSAHSDNNWTEETVAAGKVYTDRMYGDVTLTAVWEENAANVKVTVREQNADGTYTDTVVINGKQLDGSVVDLANYIGAKTGFKAVVITNSGKAFALNNGKFTVVGGTNYDIIIQRDREQYTFTVNYVMSDGSTAPATVTKTLYFGQSDSVTSPVVTGYTADKTVATVDAISKNTTVTVTYTLDKHNVTVHYVYEGGAKAAEDKTVTVDYGKDYSVESPKITGYTADKTVVSGTMGTSDVSVTVTYKINSHNLTIIYTYAEKEYPDSTKEYTLKYGETYDYAVPAVEGFTASQSSVEGTMGDSDVTVTVTYKIITFTVTFKDWNGTLLKEETVKWNQNATAPAAPARDGYTFKGWDKAFTNIKTNTEVNALYEINTYTLSFDANGGSAVGDIKQAYATAVTAPVTTRTGYTFVKWTGDDGSEFPSIMPAKNIKFTASWTANKYTIAFDANNGTGMTASVNATYDADAVLTANGFNRTGYTFAGWNTAKDGTGTTYADKATVKNLASDNGATVTLYAQWTANEYTVTYRVDGKEIGKQTYKFGEAITAIDNPTKEGYTFTGWRDALPAVMPANDITVDAVFTVNTYKLIYTVDGAEYKSFEVKYGEAVTAIAEPVKTGYTFSGWNGVPAAMPAHDVTVTGTFTVNSYKLIFKSDGEVYDEKTYEFGAAVTAPEAPSKTGYTFAGWDKTVPATMPAEDTVITAKWTVNRYTVTFDTDGGTAVDAITQDYGTAVTAPAAPTKTGYTFAGWTPEVPATMPAENITVKAQWNINSYTLTVKYVYENGTEAAETHTETVEYNAAYNVASPSITGYTPDLSAVTGTMGAEDKEITVTYKANAYTATFDPDNGSDVIEKGFSFGEKIVAPENPTKDGYTFAGWTPEIPETMPANDLSFKATWTANSDTKVTVKYCTEKLDGGYDVETVVTGGTTGEEFTATAKSIEGFTFNADASTVSGTVAADGSLVLELYYTRNTYTVTYYVDGAEYKSEDYKYGAAVTMLAAPAKTGYTFSGWDNAVTAMPAENVTVNGTFTANTYYVEFNANGGSGSMDDQEFTYDAEAALTKNAFTKTGYTFTGWSTTSNGVDGYTYTDGETVKNLCTASGAKYVLYAQWTANIHTVTFKPENGEQDTTKDVAFDSVIGLPAEPTKDGYEFQGWFNGDEKLTADTVLNVDADVTYTAKWAAKGDTPYTVKYLLENLDGSYDETVENKTGATDATAEAEKKVFTGFTFDEKNSVVSGVITADGKLTLTLKYTRNSYKLTYKSDGNTVGEKTYKYGAAVESVSSPEKTGYTFAGWDNLPDTMPAADTTVNAKWTVNQYTVTFDTDGGTAVDAITQDYGTAVTAPAAPTKTGYVFAGWDKEIPATMPAENITLKAQWTPADDTLVTVKHYLEKLDGTYELKDTVTDKAVTGSTYTATTNSYDGFTFDSASVITGTVAADGSLVLTLNYKRNSYKLTFVVDGESNETEVKFGAAVSYPADPTKTGYTFTGWDKTVETMPSEDVVITAVFAANEYTVIFDANGGEGSMDEQGFTYDKAQALTKNTFTKTDFVFVGWNTASDGTGTSFADGAEVKNLTTAKGGFVLYAQWKADINHNGTPDDEETPWRVSYVAGEGGTVVGVEGEKVLDGMTPVSVPEAKANSGYAFRFWSTDGATKVEPKETVIKSDTTFTAIFGVDKNGDGIADVDEDKLTVVYDMNGTKQTEYVLSGLAPVAVPSKETANLYKPDGKCFKAWDGDVTAAIKADTTFTAIYADDLNGDEIPDDEQAHYTVTYLPGEHGTLTGETTVTVVENMPYDKAWEPTVTPDKYFVFDAWDLTPDKITGNTVITAVYGEDKNNDGINDDSQERVEITFAPGEFGTLDGESVIRVVKGAYSETVEIPTVIPDADHIFKAWSPEIPEQFGESATYTATYAEDKNHNGKDDETEDKFTVKFVDYDGTVIDEQTVLTGLSATAPADPARAYDDEFHYSFTGWDKDFTNVTADITVTAVYNADAHTFGEWSTTKFATCTESGEHTRTCAVCGKTQSELLPELGHDWGEWAVTKDATCTSHGEETRICKRDASHIETRETALAEHTPAAAVKENIVDATCESAGSYDEVIYCSECGKELERTTVTVPANGHTEEVVPGKAATCEETGLTAGIKCSVCGEIIKEQEVIPALGHNWNDGVVTTPATCETDGVKTFTCKNDASHTYTETIKAIGHNWNDGVVTTPATCETNGVKTFTCKNDASHTYTETIKAIGHRYGEWTVKTPATCKSEGEEIRVCANDETHVETRVIAKIAHTEVVTPGKAATCTEPGTTDYIVCSVCGTVLSEVTEIPALGHDWGEWKVTVKPTYTSTGVAMRECARCGKQEEKELPAYDHDNDYLVIIAPDTVSAGNEVDVKAMRLPAETIEEDAVWTTSDQSIINIYNGKFYAFGEGTVTLTATSADGKLVATKTITVTDVDYDNARIIKFINMNKMHYIVAGYYKVYSDGAIYWSRSSECPIEVYAYSTFNYPTYIVYVDGKAVEADANGVYHIPAGNKNVVVSIAGATTEDPDGTGSGTGTKVSFWELIVRFFRKLFSIFKKK